MFSSDCGSVSGACAAYRRKTKGMVEVTAKLVNRLKVYSVDITNFSDIQRGTSKLNNDMNTEFCHATGKLLSALLVTEKPYLLKTALILQDILTNP